MNTIFGTCTKRTFVVSLVLALAACGGSGSDDEATSSYSSFDQIDADAVVTIGTYIEGNGDLNAPVTAGAALSSGSVAYDGFIRGDIDGATLTGTVTMNVNFGDASVAGSATDFFHETDGAYEGSLSGSGIVDAGATGTKPQLTATLDGSLTNGSVPFDTTLLLDGDFLTFDGTDGAAVAGLVEGNVGTATFDDGLFAAEQ
ncbi:hypothetical protein [Yoonia sp. I 8.24]|uniref:hypothetical protein n=1 Tax=Yoonia sp. I 8.24 TaxID=1537229 RepID=UPI001EDFB33A|nr:hypothetical protein [Yoonia sp. I 8.24]MCG3268667.1 hypothetical protein [Yoonia sp. I 8.24]